MDEIVCARSAFRYWRCPPQIREMYPALPSSCEPWSKLRNAPFVRDVLGLPLDVVGARKGPHANSQLRKSFLWSDKMDPVETYDSEMDFSVASPLYTLFTLARVLDFYDLVLAMHEMCGWFAVFEMPKSIREETTRVLKEQKERGDTVQRQSYDGESDHVWKCVFAKAGRKAGEPTSLWQRSPIIDVSELHKFADKMRGCRWGDRFYRAAMLVRGIAASPLEVQGYLLLALPRSMGGAGFADALLNDWTPLSSEAMKLCSKRTCYGDIVIADPKSMRTVIVECQGEMIHGAGAIQASDADRVAALQSMGYTVLLVSHEMLNDSAQLKIIVKTICREIGIGYRSKTSRMLMLESELRSKLFCNWANLV